MLQCLALLLCVIWQEMLGQKSACSSCCGLSMASLFYIYYQIIQFICETQNGMLLQWKFNVGHFMQNDLKDHGQLLTILIAVFWEADDIFYCWFD